MAPSSEAQKTRELTPVRSRPPEAIESTTSDPLSEEVTKKAITSSSPSPEVNHASGYSASMRKRAVGTESPTACAKPGAVASSS